MKKQNPTKPFFSRFLDEQLLRQVTGGGNPPLQTMKFPSDSDDDNANDPPSTTMKFPSDSDDCGDAI